MLDRIERDIEIDGALTDAQRTRLLECCRCTTDGDIDRSADAILRAAAACW